MRPSIVNISLLAAGCQEVVLAWAWTLDCGIMTIMSPSCVCATWVVKVSTKFRGAQHLENPPTFLPTNAFTIKESI